jgi:hypothetical protein
MRGDCLMETYGSYCDKVEVVKTVEDLSLVVEDLLRDIYADVAHPLDKKRLREAKAAETYDSKDYYTHGASGGTEAVFDSSGRSHW